MMKMPVIINVESSLRRAIMDPMENNAEFTNKDFFLPMLSAKMKLTQMKHELTVKTMNKALFPLMLFSQEKSSK